MRFYIVILCLCFMGCSSSVSTHYRIDIIADFFSSDSTQFNCQFDSDHLPPNALFDCTAKNPTYTSSFFKGIQIKTTQARFNELYGSEDICKNKEQVRLSLVPENDIYSSVWGTLPRDITGIQPPYLLDASHSLDLEIQKDRINPAQNYILSLSCDSKNPNTIGIFFLLTNTKGQYIRIHFGL